MLKDYLTILFSCYLMSNLFLIPVFIMHLSGLAGRLAIGWQVRIHKSTVVLVLLSPIIIYLYSVPFQSLGTVGRDTGMSSLQRAAVSGGAAVGQPENVSGRSLPASPPLMPERTKSIVLDAIWFVIEYLLLMTVIGGGYFCFRLAVQWCFLRRIEGGCIRRTSWKNLDIIFSSRISLPFSVRLLRKKIYMPDTFSASERQIILNHEMHHFRKHHHFWTLLESMVNCLLWYNPISLYLKRKGALLREMECDTLTLKKTDRFVYSKLLVKLAESHISGRDRIFITQNLISRHTLKKRIAHMLDNPTSKRGFVLGALVIIALIVSSSAFFYYGAITDKQSQAEILDRINARYGETLAARKSVKLEKVPNVFIDALLVNEDRDFFKHRGIKLYNIVKAMVFNLFHDRERWLGASTITQQLAKHFLNPPLEKTLGRKFRELKIAKVLEKNFSKTKILEMYMNTVYFGSDAWGLNQAVQTYFGHSYEQLTLRESALLVPSLVKPTLYNAIENPALAKQRQARLIKSMAELGIVEQAGTPRP